MPTAREEILAHYDEIAEVFPRFDLPAFRRCWELPALLTLPESVVAIPDEAAFERVFGGMMDSLRAQGLTRSVPEQIHIHTFGAATALASVLWIRYAGEAVLERLGATYTLVRRDGEWRVNALVAHAPEAVIALDR